MPKFKVQHRRGTTEQWEIKGDNIIPEDGEIVLELDKTNSAYKLKVGDGIHTYNELAYTSGNGDTADSGVGESTGINGEIFNDYENNIAQGPFTHAEGYHSIAGVKGYYFTKIDIATDKLSAVFYLSTVQTDSEMTEDTRDLNFTIDYAEGDVISYVSGSKYLDVAKITAIDVEKQTVTVSAISGKTLVKGAFDTGIDDQIFYVLNKPDAGPVSFGHYAHAEGENAIAIERSSHAEGRDTIARGQYSHAEGRQTKATYAAHSEGYKTEAMGNYAHAENDRTKATGLGAHAEGQITQATGSYSHAEGAQTTAAGTNSHSEGSSTKALAPESHSEGYKTTVESTSKGGHAEGYESVASGNNGAHAEGMQAKAQGESSHAEGRGSIASGQASHAEGLRTQATAVGAHAEGNYTIAAGQYQHVEGKHNKPDTENKYIHIAGNGTGTGGEKNAYTLDWEGNGWFAGNVSVGTNKEVLITENSVNTKIAKFPGIKSETNEIFNDYEGNSVQRTVVKEDGTETIIKGMYSHVEGKGNNASGRYAHAEGLETKAHGDAAHAEGKGTTASNYAHAEGFGTKAMGTMGSHAEGWTSEANGESSHAENRSIANGQYSHAEGYMTTANGDYQHVQGRRNIIDKENKYLHIVGNGGNATGTESNAHTLDWSGNAWFAGEVTIGANKEKLATESVVDTKIAEFVGSAPEALDTLNELAAALGNDENFATTVSTELGKKVDKVEGKQLSTEDFTTGYKNTLDSLSLEFDKKVDKVDGKQLSTEDFTTELKTKLEGLSNTSEQVQADYNQEDPTKPDYIKNRTHYDSFAIKYFENYTVMGASGVATGYVSDELLPVIGETYSFNNSPNSEKYIAEGNEWSCHVGNLNFDYNPDMNYYEVAIRGDYGPGQQYNISLYHHSGELKTLDEKYLPEALMNRIKTLEEKIIALETKIAELTA